MIRRALLPLLIVLAALGMAPAAASASADAIFEDCQDGRLDKRYSGKDYREALADIPVDLDEYTNCRELIRSAQQGVRGSGGAGPGSTVEGSDGFGALLAGEGGLPLGPDSKPIDPVGIASPEEREEVEKARTFVPDQVVPASAGVAPGYQGADLPMPLIILLVLTIAGSLAAVAPRVRDLLNRRT